MIFLHTSDLHLGKRLHEASLIPDQRHILGQICRIAEENGCDAVLVAGDIYDKSSPSAEAVALFDWFATELTRRGIALIANYGNHDSPDRAGYAAALLNRSGVYLSPRFDGTVVRATLEDSFGEVRFYLLPFLKPATASAAYWGEEFSSFDEALRYATERIETDSSVRNVLLCHQFVTGGERSESEERSVGGADNISAELFDAFDYCALGHLHKPQKILRETLRYSGSPLKYSLDEAGCEKSVALVRLYEKGRIDVQTVPLKPLRDVRRLQGSYEELTLRRNYEGTATEDFLHVLLTDEGYVPDALLKLRAIYPNILKLEYSNVRTSLRAEFDALAEASDGAEGLTPLELFAELYRLQNNAPLDGSGAALAEKIFKKLSEENE